MPIVKTFSVGDGDTFYIQHGSDNFSVIDCNLEEGRREEIVDEIIEMSKGKAVSRFISTHPDDDHIHGIGYLDDRKAIVNFYCVQNAVLKDTKPESFEHYKKLRDGDKAFTLSKGCSRRWSNQSDDTRESSGIVILCPNTATERYKDALQAANDGERPNNISIVARYSIGDGATFCWFGDFATSFMEDIHDDIELRKAAIIFAPHHGRQSGTLPQAWVDDLEPKVIVVGDAPSEHLEYYRDFDTIKPNSAGDATFHCHGSKVHVYCSVSGYAEDLLDDDGLPDAHAGYYVGTLNL